MHDTGNEHCLETAAPPIPFLIPPTHHVQTQDLGGAPPPEMMGLPDPYPVSAPRPTRMRPGDELPDDCKLYVGNLSPVLTDATLKSMFEPFGPVLHAAAVIDPTTGQGKGFGFVHYADSTAARMAAQGLHGKVGKRSGTGCGLLVPGLCHGAKTCHLH